MSHWISFLPSYIFLKASGCLAGCLFRLNIGRIWDIIKEKCYRGVVKMINMPECIREDYLLVEKLRNFCKEHGLKTSQNKVELLNSILSYAGKTKKRLNLMRFFNG